MAFVAITFLRRLPWKPLNTGLYCPTT